MASALYSAHSTKHSVLCKGMRGKVSCSVDMWASAKAIYYMVFQKVSSFAPWTRC